MISIEELGNRYDLFAFERAINEGDIPEIVKLLKKPLLNLSHETRLKLAACLDPDNPKPKKTGSKPRVTRNNEIRNQNIFFIYRHLCRNLELARYILNAHREEFDIVDDDHLTDENGEFAPAWKYPEKERSRNAVPIPLYEQIQEYVCNSYGISGRTFDSILSKGNKK